MDAQRHFRRTGYEALGDCIHVGLARWIGWIGEVRQAVRDIGQVRTSTPDCKIGCLVLAYGMRRIASWRNAIYADVRLGQTDIKERVSAPVTASIAAEKLNLWVT